MFNFLKRIFAAVFFCAVCGTGFSENWYVCLSSFSKLENAGRFSFSLSEKNIDTVIACSEKDGKKLYRVLFSEKFTTADEAREKRNELEDSGKADELGISGLWICKAVEFLDENVAAGYVKKAESENIPPETENKEVVLVPETVLSSNKTEEIPLSEEKPYSVKIRTYKEEQNAVRDKNRLKEKEIDSYILKTYDDEDYFNFDLHSGAFATKEETEALQQKLEDSGISDTEISDYKEIEESVEKYNEIVDNQTVTYEDGEGVYPGTFAYYVTEMIRQFPINKDYQVKNIVIIDNDNLNQNEEIRSYLLKSTKEFFLEEILEESGNVHAVSLVNYYDELYDRNVFVVIVQGEAKGLSSPEIPEENHFSYKFYIKDGILDSEIYENGDQYALTGISEDKSLGIFMLADNFETRETFTEFLNSMKNDSSLLVYPQVRKTLAVLPDVNPEVERRFLGFKLEQLTDEYAASKGYADWALPMTGHWNASGLLSQDGDVLEIGFFDLDYDYNAGKIHEMFMKSHEENSNDYDEHNHKSDYEKASAWYLENFIGGNNELSFSTGSYIIAIDGLNGNLNEKDLETAADDLKIWK